MNDASLKKLVEEEWDWEPSMDAVRIGVGVKDGVFTLTGHVNSYAQKRAAEPAVQRVKGVRAIAIDSRVTLQGKVDAWHDREVALQAAWAAPGIKNVTHNIRIG